MTVRIPKSLKKSHNYIKKNFISQISKKKFCLRNVRIINLAIKLITQNGNISD